MHHCTGSGETPVSMARRARRCPWGGARGLIALLGVLWLGCPAVALGAGSGEMRETDLSCLREAYPASIVGTEVDAQGRTWLLVRQDRGDPTRVPYDGGEADAASIAVDDVRASMAQPYPLEPLRPPTPDGFRPGRSRCYAFLRALYGVDRAAVRTRLAPVSILGTTVLFSTAGGAARSLERVAHALRELVRRRPDLASWVVPLGGGFNWRLIQGEKQRSPHSFGIALDLNPRKGPYWRWSGLRRHPSQDSYPREIVDIFEENGFIWGGKWHEYDVMHFEYRPEILCKARRAAFALPEDAERRP